MSDDLNILGLLDEGDIVLDEAALALAALDHPDIDRQPYRRFFDAVSAHLERYEAGTARERAGALADVLADEFGLTGDVDTYEDPANADMIRVVDRRRGLPIALSILYVAAARRNGWEANVLDVPGHVLVLVGGDAAPVIVDPFNNGAVVDREGLLGFVARGRTTPVDAVSHVAAMPNRAILLRLLANQASRADEAGQGRRALELYRRMTTMAPDYGHAWWESARLELIDGDVGAARRSLTAMLEVTREPVLRGRVSQILSELAKQ